MSILYPKIYINKVQEITYEYLNQKGIRALILDVDNTLIDYKKNLSEEIIRWAKDIQEKGIILYILSNTNKKEKVKNVSEKLGKIKYKTFAKKPLKNGFLQIKKELNLPSEKIAIVGDQIFTDIIGGNRCKMFTILVDPIKEREFWYTAWKRPIEEKIKRKIKKGLI